MRLTLFIREAHVQQTPPPTPTGSPEVAPAAAALPERLRVPVGTSRFVEVSISWTDIAWSVGAVAAAIVAGLIIHAVGFAIARRVAARTPVKLAPEAVRYARKPARLLIPLFIVQTILPALTLPAAAAEVLRHIVSLMMIASAAWLVISMSKLIEDALGLKYRLDVADNLAARTIHTQVRVLRRTAVVVVVIVAAAVMLMTFPRVKELGASLLASAGLAGLAVGFAARPVLQNLIAGIQIALTQPIRIDDVVIVAGEFGWVEEISSTFVIIRVWDQRRLVVPLNFFVENTFQNWTRTNADLLGSVFLWVDYTVPVDELRAELRRLVEGSELWDKRVCGVQVVETSERAVQLRALVSAASAPRAWDLRCLVREGLIKYLQEKHPGGLPRVRAEVAGVGGEQVSR